tara:strand:+ start:1201 stop:1935 length:735 start_codon:yes stop_codon:yes gene_type:complete
MSKILVIGESCLDIFNYGVCNRLCPEAPVPVFNPSHSVENGGMATNVYNNILALDAAVHLHTNNNWKNITKTRFIDYKTNHMFMRLDCKDAEFGASKIKKISFKKYDAVVISDYNKGFLSCEDIEYIGNKHPCTFLDTKKELGEWCKSISFIKINNYEYERTKAKIDSEIYEKLIITLGPEGCKFQDVIYPVPRVEIKDTSGAGDTFIAGLAVKYIQNKNIEEAIEFANRCATKVVQKRGVSSL